MNNKRNLIIFILIVAVVCISGIAIARKNSGKEAENVGGFTFDRISSYDGKYYAISDKTEKGNIAVSIYEIENDVFVFSFEPVRASDFWGICWESSSYNIWVQSGDIGVICYSYENDEWKLNENVERPNDIISKYD